MVTRVTAKKSPTKGRGATKGVQKSLTDAVVGTLGLQGERMSKVDTAWLRMDSASNLMMIVGVWVIKPGISYGDLAERLQDRLLRYPRFVQCAIRWDAFDAWFSELRLHSIHSEVGPAWFQTDTGGPARAVGPQNPCILESRQQVHPALVMCLQRGKNCFLRPAKVGFLNRAKPNCRLWLNRPKNLWQTFFLGLDNSNRV